MSAGELGGLWPRSLIAVGDGPRSDFVSEINEGTEANRRSRALGRGVNHNTERNSERGQSPVLLHPQVLNRFSAAGQA